MPNYRRASVPGGTFFLTLVTERRAPIFREEGARGLLRESIEACRERRPFTVEGMVLLPDHLHLMMTLPKGDADFSGRVAAIKTGFTRSHLAAGGVEQERGYARVKGRRRGVWQRWFWEHHIRDQEDFNNHLDYIHYNPVHHDLARCPHEWAWSTFRREVGKRMYREDWCCRCEGKVVEPMGFGVLQVNGMEGE